MWSLARCPHPSTTCKHCHPRLCSPHLGALKKLVVGHNDRGEAPGWHLAWCVVMEEGTGAVTYFPCDR